MKKDVRHRAAAPQIKKKKKRATKNACVTLSPHTRTHLSRPAHWSGPGHSSRSPTCASARCVFTTEPPVRGHDRIQRLRISVAADRAEAPSLPPWVGRLSLPLSRSLSCTCSDPHRANHRRLRPDCRRETHRAARRQCLQIHSGWLWGVNLIEEEAVCRQDSDGVD